MTATVRPGELAIHPMNAPGLRRELGLGSAILLTVGSVLGSGIFMKPLLLSKVLPDESAILWAWLALGLVCTAGALAFAELGAMFPDAGGQYRFLLEAHGKFVAYVYGWTLLLVINTGSLAGLAVAVSDNLQRLLGFDSLANEAVAIGIILVLAAVNHFGVRAGALLNSVTTLAKLGALAVVLVAGVLATRTESVVSSAAPVSSGVTLTGLAAAAVAIFWAYEGWYQLSFSAGEIRKPERNVPLALACGMAVLVVLYTSINAIYLKLVPLPEMRDMATGDMVPRAAVARGLGPGMADGITALIAVSAFGAAIPNLLSTPRALYAMARDGLFPSAFVALSPRFGTPARAIWAQAIWASVLVVVLRAFDDLTKYVVFAALIFYALAVLGVFILRRRRPDLPRPFRCPGYPVTPALFVLIVLGVIVVTLTDPAEQRNALLGLVVISLASLSYGFTRLRR